MKILKINIALALFAVFSASVAQTITPTFTKVAIESTNAESSSVLRAELTGFPFLTTIGSITINDSNSERGGTAGAYSGFDVDAFFIDIDGNYLTTDDQFYPSSFIFKAGEVRDGSSRISNTSGSLNGSNSDGTVNEEFATLNVIDADFFSKGSISLGDGGSLTANFNPPIPVGSSLFLVVAEVGSQNGENVTGFIEVRNTLVIADPKFSFPLSCADKNCESPYSQGAYTSSMINSVLDHQMDSIYKNPDGKVVAFTGEKGEGLARSLGCYPKVGGGSFNILGLYEGTTTQNEDCSPSVGLNYDNHPGYDYNAEIGTPVKAAAPGTVVEILNIVTGKYGRCVPRGIDTEGCDAWGYVGIDHGNGYVTQYGHLDTIFFESGDWVDEGDDIGLSGKTSPPSKPVGPHLHFEVLKKHDDKQYGYAFVDPYGWEGQENDHIAEINGIENFRLWKYDPRECLFNWAELSFNHLFSPIGTGTEIFHPFNYRYYQITNSYLGVSSVDNHVYYVGPDNVLQNVGDLSHWLSVAGCHS